MIKKIKLLFWGVVSYLLLIDFTFWATRNVWDPSIKTWLTDISNDNILNDKSSDWLSILGSIFVWVKDSLSSLIMLIAVAVFLYIWAKLAIARWNPEEFKKAMLQLIYAVIWIFVVAIAWATVTLVAGINF